MFNWLAKKYSPIGLDVGHTGIRGVQLRWAGGVPHIHAALEIKINDIDSTSQLDSKDTNMTEKQFSDRVKKLMDRGGFMGREVFLHCPADKMDMRPITLPTGKNQLGRETILGVLKTHMQEHVPFAQEDTVIDYVTVKEDYQHGNLTVMTFTADGQWIRKRIKLLQDIGLHPLAVDSLPCAIGRVGRRADEHDNTSATTGEENQKDKETTDQKGDSKTDRPCETLTAVIDMGYCDSRLIVCNGQGPILCRRFQLGGRELTEILAQRLMIEPRQAENLKLAYGLDCQTRRLRFAGEGDRATAVVDEKANGQDKSEIAKTIFAALQGSLIDYVEGLIRTLNYVIAENSGSVLKKILLSGQGAHTSNMTEFLSDQFELPVEIISHRLLDEIKGFLPASRANIGAWTVALGLALTEENG